MAYHFHFFLRGVIDSEEIKIFPGRIAMRQKIILRLRCHD